MDEMQQMTAPTVHDSDAFEGMTSDDPIETVAVVYDQTVSDYGYAFRRAAGITFWSVYEPDPAGGIKEKHAVWGEAQDMDSAYIACEAYVSGRGASIARRSQIVGYIRQTNPHLGRRAVESIADEVVATLVGG